MNFNAFQAAVAAQFERMQKHALFVVDVDRDALWTTYLASFPEGSNPKFRERTEHDCSCCKGFIRNIGPVVAVIDGKLVSVWDVKVPKEPAYEIVARGLAAIVRAHKIRDKFLHYENAVGVEKNFEQMAEGTKTWTHFHVNLLKQHVTQKDKIPTLLGDVRTTHDVMLRSLTEITQDAIETVLDLIAQNSLYRGAEHQHAVTEFRKAKREFDLLPTPEARDLYVWSAEAIGSVARMRNTAIGTLLVDLSTGVDLEAAVKSFEAKVAPTNYKRPTALVTKAMIEKAKATVEELGLTSALERRYASINDITINNVLFASRATKAVFDGDVFDELAAGTKAGKQNFDKVEEMPIAQFLANVVPRAESIEVYLENQHAGNLVSLVAPVDPTSRGLFKWDNRFSWSYNGDVTDAIKERVKAAGGNVTGDLCCRLAWEGKDDLDFHLKCDGQHTFYMSRRGVVGSHLDVDANGMDGLREHPVENIYFKSRKDLKEGKVYTLYVNQWAPRGSLPGFEAEIDFMGAVTRFSYAKAMRQGENVQVARFRYIHGEFQIIESLPSTTATKKLWGISTQNFHKVNAVMLSPNHWDEKAVGNKHYFFMLDKCVNDGVARGFYNEFLHSALDPHRKVLEMVGAKMKTDKSDEQLSGLGFSETVRNTFVCRVKGSFNRLIKIVF